MTRALVTITCGSFYEQMATLTHPTLQAYADRVGATFIVWRDHPGHRMPHYRKLELAETLEEFDRVLYLDTDILVRDDAPDVFELVPADQLGILEEGKYCDRRNSVEDMFTRLGLDVRTWDGQYYNTGVMVLSPVHKGLFVRPTFEWDNFREQTYLNCMLSQSGLKVFPLPHRFNRLYIMDEYYGQQRHDSYFLHYAGIQDMMSEKAELELLQNDLDVWRIHRPAYQFPASAKQPET